MAKSIDTFLNHKPSVQRDRTPILKKWKEGGEIDVWMHVEVGLEPVWRHPLPKLVPIEDRDTRESHVMLWSDNLPSPTAEDLLRKQWQKHDDGTFKVEMSDDLLTNLWRWAFAEVQAERLSWVAPLFHFKGENQVKGRYVEVEKTLHAAGLYSGFSRVETQEEKDELRDAGIRLTEAWAESIVAKCSYIFVVVDDSSPGDGLQIAVETVLLGDKVRQVIKDKMIEKGKDEGNPLLNPYAIKWKYDDREKEFSKKYHAIAMSQLKLTPRIKELIEGEPPSIAHLMEPYSQESTLAFLQQHAVDAGKKIPWEKLMPAKGATARRGADVDFAFGAFAPNKDATKEVKVEEKKAEPKTYATSTGISIPEEHAVECDGCKKPVDVRWNKCVECGAKYADNGLVDPPEPPAAKEVVRRGSARKPIRPAGEKGAEEPIIPFD